MPDPDLLDELAEEEPPRRRWALWLLLIPAVSVLYPPLYSHRTPTISGIPFFVWYQLAAVVFGGFVTGVVYLLQRP